MKKALVIIIAAVMTAVLCISASAAINSNHLIDEGFPRFNDEKETEWELFCWTVVDTKITKMGYKLDGGDIVWVDESVDVRDNAKNLEGNDCFEDLELDNAIVNMSLANGLETFFGYRIHITLDTSKIEKGEHTLEVAVKYEDDTIGNPLRDNSVSMVKTLDAVEDGEQGGEEQQGGQQGGEEQQGGQQGEEQQGGQQGGEQQQGGNTTPTTNPSTADASVIAIAAVAAVALAGVVVAKKVK